MEGVRWRDFPEILQRSKFERILEGRGNRLGKDHVRRDMPDTSFNSEARSGRADWPGQPFSNFTPAILTENHPDESWRSGRELYTLWLRNPEQKNAHTSNLLLRQECRRPQQARWEESQMSRLQGAAAGPIGKWQVCKWQVVLIRRQKNQHIIT